MKTIDQTAACLSKVQKAISTLKEVEALIVKVTTPRTQTLIANTSWFCRVIRYLNYYETEKLHIGARNVVDAEYDVGWVNMEIPHEMILDTLNKIRDKALQEIRDAGINC